MWVGLGFIAPFLIMMLSFLMQLGFHYFSDFKYDYLLHHIGLALGCFLAGLICWFLGLKLNNQPGQVVIDKQTGREFELKKIHTCFLIRFEYWYFVAASASVVLLAMNLF